MNFINTGLDERIVKSFNPDTPKTYRPTVVHRRTGDYIAEIPVKADEVEIHQPTHVIHHVGLHPLIANYEAPVSSDLVKVKEISRKFRNLKTIYAHKDETGRTKFLIQDQSGETHDISPRKLSHMLHELDARREELRQRWKGVDKRIDPETLVNLTPDDANNYFDLGAGGHDYAEWEDEYMDGDLMNAIDQYSANFDEEINGYYRGYISYIDPERRRVSETLEKAINGFHLPENMTVHRMLTNNGDIEDIMDQFRVGLAEGGPVQDLGFASTSVCEEAAMKFGRGNSNRVHLIIDVPKGHGRGAYIAPVSNYPQEYEFLLNKGSQFRVHSINENPEINGYDVHLQLIGRTLVDDSDHVYKSITYTTNDRSKHFTYLPHDLQFFPTIDDKIDWDLDHHCTTHLYTP